MIGVELCDEIATRAAFLAAWGRCSFSLSALDAELAELIGMAGSLDALQAALDTLAGDPRFAWSRYILALWVIAEIEAVGSIEFDRRRRELAALGAAWSSPEWIH